MPSFNKFRTHLLVLASILVLILSATALAVVTQSDGTVIPPTGKAFDLEFGQTTKWDGDQLIVISAFLDSAAQARQLGLS